MEKVYALKGRTKCYIRYNGTLFTPDSNFYAELNEKDYKFFSQFLDDVSVKTRDAEKHNDVVSIKEEQKNVNTEQNVTSKKRTSSK